MKVFVVKFDDLYSELVHSSKLLYAMVCLSEGLGVVTIIANITVHFLLSLDLTLYFGLDMSWMISLVQRMCISQLRIDDRGNLIIKYGFLSYFYTLTSMYLVKFQIIHYCPNFFILFWVTLVIGQIILGDPLGIVQLFSTSTWESLGHYSHLMMLLCMLAHDYWLVEMSQFS